jgi:hypothetical protein
MARSIYDYTQVTARAAEGSLSREAAISYGFGGMKSSPRSFGGGPLSAMPGDVFSEWVAGNWQALEVYLTFQRTSTQRSVYDLLNIWRNLTERMPAQQAVRRVESIIRQKQDNWLGDLLFNAGMGFLGSYLAGPASFLGWGRWAFSGISAVSLSADLWGDLSELLGGEPDEWDLPGWMRSLSFGATVAGATELAGSVTLPRVPQVLDADRFAIIAAGGPAAVTAQAAATVAGGIQVATIPALGGALGQVTASVLNVYGWLTGY